MGLGEGVSLKASADLVAGKEIVFIFHDLIVEIVHALQTNVVALAVRPDASLVVVRFCELAAAGTTEIPAHSAVVSPRKPWPLHLKISKTKTVISLYFSRFLNTMFSLLVSLFSNFDI